MKYQLASCEANKETDKASPGDVVEKFYKLINDKEYDKAAWMCSNKGKLLNEDEVQKVEKRISWTAGGYENKDGIKEVIIKKRQLSGTMFQPR